MRTNYALKWLVPPVFVLALIAALAGLWPGPGQPYPLTSFRGVVELGVFPAITLANLAMTIILLKNIATDAQHSSR